MRHRENHACSANATDFFNSLLMGTLSEYVGLRLALALGAIVSGGFWLATRFQHKRMAVGLERPTAAPAEAPSRPA
jgi:hypothetical protein